MTVNKLTMITVYKRRYKNTRQKIISMLKITQQHNVNQIYFLHGTLSENISVFIVGAWLKVMFDRQRPQPPWKQTRHKLYTTTYLLYDGRSYVKIPDTPTTREKHPSQTTLGKTCLRAQILINNNKKKYVPSSIRKNHRPPCINVYHHKITVCSYQNVT